MNSKILTISKKNYKSRRQFKDSETRPMVCPVKPYGRPYSKEFEEYVARNFTVRADGKFFKGDKEFKLYGSNNEYRKFNIKYKKERHYFLAQRATEFSFFPEENILENADKQVDHILGNRRDNRINNLRLVSAKQNQEFKVKRLAGKKRYQLKLIKNSGNKNFLIKGRIIRKKHHDLLEERLITLLNEFEYQLTA
jgi:hypothetical protein